MPSRCCRFLLCGQEMPGDTSQPPQRRRTSTSSSSSVGAASGGTSSLAGAGAGVGSGPPSLEVTPAAATRAIQTMGTNDFTDTVACFMQVAWAAAAGKLHLASSTQPMKDPTSFGSSTYGSNSRSRQSSTGHFWCAIIWNVVACKCVQGLVICVMMTLQEAQPALVVRVIQCVFMPVSVSNSLKCLQRMQI